MLLKYYKSEIPLNIIRNLSGTDLNGTSLLGIRHCLEKLNFEAEAFEAEKNIWNELQAEDFPFIAHVINENALSHFVIVYEKSDDTIIIVDPAVGVVKKSINDFSNCWTGIFLLAKPNEFYVPVKEKEKGIGTFLPIIYEQKKVFFLVIFFSLFLTLFSTISSYYYQFVFDSLIPNKDYSTLSTISIALVLSYFLKAVIEYFRNQFLIIIGQKTNMSIALKYLNHLIKLPLNFFTTRKVGEVISRFLDASKIVDALSNSVLSIFLDVMVAILIAIILAIQNYSLFFITLCSLPLYSAVIIYFVKKYDLASEQEMAASAKLNSTIIESIKGIETVKSYTGEDILYSKIIREYKDMVDKSINTFKLENIQNILKSTINLIFHTLVLWIGSRYVINSQFTIGQLITYNALLVFFTNPIQNIVNLQVKIQSAKIANKRLNDVFQTEIEKFDSIENVITNEQEKDFSYVLKNVFYSFGMKEPILKNIYCDFKINENIAIVGPSGSGKSTLAKLLVRFYEPTDGEIYYQNTNLQNIGIKYLRRQVTYVPQDSFFFYGTIEENLLFGLDYKPSQKELIKVTKLVGIYEYIEKQYLKFDSLIEEGAVNLSGGQKQRLAIARSLLNDNKVIIFDEATSNMDSILEKYVINNLMNISDRTIILISHRLELTKNCDQIIVMNKGQIVGNGNHDTLNIENSLYQRLLQGNIKE